MPGDERGEGGEVGDSASLLVCSAGFADGGVEIRPRLRLVLGLEEMADGEEAAWVTIPVLGQQHGLVTDMHRRPRVESQVP